MQYRLNHCYGVSKKKRSAYLSAWSSTLPARQEQPRLLAAAAVSSTAALASNDANGSTAGVRPEENNAFTASVGKVPSVDDDTEKKENEEWARKMQLLDGGSSTG